MSVFDSGNTNGVYQSEELCRWFSFVEIQDTTNDFDDALVIGKGGFGKVYKGFIDGGATTVAIKRSNAESKQGAAEFWTEIKTLSKLRHTHLVTLIGYSDDCEEMILVYEYMANGTLADHLYKNSSKGQAQDLYWCCPRIGLPSYGGHISSGNLEVAIKRWKEGTSRERNLDQFRSELQVHSHLRHLHIVSLIGYCIDKHEVILVYEYMVHGSLYQHLYEANKYPLKWEKRLEICIGVARGRQYLHAGTRQTIIHRNLKPTNILLDENWNAKVVTHIESSTGTVGYIDPEYHVNANFTIKSDVYSFGVILLELLCGRKPMIYSRDEDQVNLVRWFKTNIKMGTVDQIIDPYLIDKIAPKCLKEYVMNAENCVCDKGIERPSMDDSVRYGRQSANGH
ncbi:hypothetical protein ACSBR2_040082 [Camellia fascicularis]